MKIKPRIVTNSWHQNGLAVPIFSVKSGWGRQITPFVNPLNQEN